METFGLPSDRTIRSCTETTTCAVQPMAGSSPFRPRARNGWALPKSPAMPSPSVQTETSRALASLMRTRAMPRGRLGRTTMCPVSITTPNYAPAPFPTTAKRGSPSVRKAPSSSHTPTKTANLAPFIAFRAPTTPTDSSTTSKTAHLPKPHWQKLSPAIQTKISTT